MDETTPCPDSSSGMYETPNMLHSEDNDISFTSNTDNVVGNGTLNHMAGMQAEITAQQAENTESLKTQSETIDLRIEYIVQHLQTLDSGLKKQIRQANESHEDIRYLRGTLMDSEMRQTDVTVICGAVLFGLFLILITFSGNEVDQKIRDFTAVVQGLEERIAVLQHDLEAEIKNNILMQANLSEYHKCMQSLSDAILNNFTQQDLHMQSLSDAILNNFTLHDHNIQLASQERSQIKDELYQLRQNMDQLKKKFEENTAELNKALDEQLEITQKYERKAEMQQNELDEQQEINQQQVLVQQHLVMTLKEVHSLNGMSLYSPESIILMCNFSQYEQIEISEWLSPSFYTHWAGYKLCLKVYPKGHGNGKRTHLSWFVYLMKGEFDDSLIWPFSGSITVQLINWKNEYKHSKEETAEFNSNTDVEAKSRVDIGHMATRGIGFTRFVALKDLHNTATDVKYLQNDCLKFKVYSAKSSSKEYV